MDAARREAERRSIVERFGIEETVIEGNGGCYSGEGNVSVFDPVVAPRENSISENSSRGKKGSLRGYRSELQKLDRNISKEEARLRKLQDRLQALKKEEFRLRDLSGIQENAESREGIKEQIDEIENRLRQLREERHKVFDAGKREGFLPGELEGKGMIP